MRTKRSPFRLLLDINLDMNDKEDISGITFAREVRMRREYAFTPIVMITSLANMELTAYRELHCYQYLIKPYNEKDIEKLAGKLLFCPSRERDAGRICGRQKGRHQL